MALTKVPNSMLVSPGGSTKNYLSNYNNNPGNGDFELNLTNGWSLFNTTITNQIPTGSIVAGASSLSFSTTSIGKLAGSYSLRVRAVDSGGGGIWSVGQGFISDAFTIDEQDRTSVMQFKFSYKGISNTTRLNVSGTTSNTLAVYIYDVTNSTWIQPTSSFGINQRTTVGFVNGSFQAVSTSTQYRIAVLAINGSGIGGGDIVVDFDDYIIGPSNYIFGSPVSDPFSYTPTIGGFGTVTGLSAQYYRDGKYLIGQVQFTSGTNSATNATIGLPSGLSIDSSIIGAASQVGVLGASATPFVGNMYAATGSSLTSIYMSPTSGSYQNGALGTAWANGTTISCNFRVPILGWASTVQMSDQTDTRVVTARAVDSSGQSIPTGAVTIVNFNTTSFDSHASITNGASWKYTAQVPGYYRVSSLINYVANAGGGSLLIYIYKNGSQISSNYTLWAATAAPYCANISDIVYLNSGDYVDIRTLHNAGANRPLTANSSYISIDRISGPATIAASERINASGANTASTSIPTGTWTAVPTATLTINSHGALNTSGQFTAPQADTYSVTANVCFTSNATGIRGVRIRKNNAATGYGSVIPATIGGAITSVPIAGLVKCNEGETITIECFQNSGGPLALSNDPDIFTTFTITRK